MSFYIRNTFIDEAVEASLLAEMGQNYVVDPDGVYSTIQAAIDAAHATNNDVNIYIKPGTYTENLVIYDKIHLIGLMSSYYAYYNNTSVNNDVVISGTITLPTSFVKGSIESVALTASSGSTIITSTSTAGSDTSFGLTFVSIFIPDAVNVISNSATLTEINFNNCFINVGQGYLFSSPSNTFYCTMLNSTIYTGTKSTARGFLLKGSNNDLKLSIETTGGANSMDLSTSTWQNSTLETYTFTYNKTANIITVLSLYSCHVVGTFNTLNTSGPSLNFKFFSCSQIPLFENTTPSLVSTYFINSSYSNDTLTEVQVVNKLYSSLANSATITSQKALLNQTASSTADIATITFTSANTTLYVRADVQGNNGAGGDVTYCSLLGYFKYDGTNITQIGTFPVPTPPDPEPPATTKDLKRNGSGDVNFATSVENNTAVVVIEVSTPANAYNWVANYTYQFL